MNRLTLQDAINTLASIPTTRKNGQRVLIATDPPYNNNTKYGKQVSDNLSDEEFQVLMDNFIGRANGVMRKKDYIAIVINDRWQPDIQMMLRKHDLYFRNHIIWHYTFGQNQKKRFTPSKAHILIYSKSKSPTFDWEKVSVPSWRSQNNDKRAGGKSGNPNKVMDDVWTDIPRLVHNSKEWMYYANQLPKKLCERIILPHVSGKSLIVDPFCGTGTFLKVAKTMKHDYLGGDTNVEAIRITNLRLQEEDWVIHESEHLRYKAMKKEQI